MDFDGPQLTKKGKQKQNKPRIEVDNTLDMHTRNPQSSSDFERLLLGSPNSSYLWIRYASFYLQLSDVSRAREIMRRALCTINFREEKERFNIWISMLNLETAFGTDQTLDEVFKEATRANDSKTVHLRLASIYQQADKTEARNCFHFILQSSHAHFVPINDQEAARTYEKARHKFAQSSKVWTQFAEFWFLQRNWDAARQLYLLA